MFNYLHNNQKGFSLIEVIVAMVLIGTIGAAVSTVYFTGTKASVSSKVRLEALAIGQDWLEEIRAERDDALVTEAFFDVVDFKTWLTSKGFNELNGEFIKTGETINNIYFYDTIIYINSDNNPLIEVVVEVKSQQENNLKVRLGTKMLME